MATYRQLLRQAYRAGGHFLIAARQAAKVAGLVTAGSIINKNVISKLERKAAGTVTGTFSGLPQQLQRELGDVSYWFTRKVFAESQRLVPIDKRYIGTYNPKDYKKIKRDLSVLVLKESSKDSVKDKFTNVESLYNKMYKNAKPLNKHFEQIDVDKGYYSSTQYEFIQKYFMSKNKRKYKTLVVSKSGMFKEYSLRYKQKAINTLVYSDMLKPDKDIENMKPMNRRWSDPQYSKNGNQELKKSGRIDETKNGWTISYDPTRQYAKFNYASLQHDMPETVYKHKHGQSLYLLTAYEKYVKEFRDAVKNKAVDIFKERLMQND